ncbi:MAG: HAMP domain-containing protein, partial [Bacteroidota bacterium]
MNKVGRIYKFRGRMSIRYKISIYVILLIAIAVCINTYTAVRAEKKVLTQKAVNYGKYISENVVFSVEKAFTSLNWIFVEQSLAKLSADKEASVVFIKVIKPNGEVYMADDRKYYGDTVDASLMAEEEKLLNNYQFSSSKDTGLLFINPVMIGNEKWRILVGLSDVPIKASIQSMILRSFVSGGLIILLGMITTFFLAKSISTPIVMLTKAAETISQKDLDYRVNIKSNDEVGLLAET